MPHKSPQSTVLPQAALDQANAPQASSSKPKPSVAAQVLVRGLARLAEGQRCFAEEFGLNYSRVFGDDYESFKGQNPETVIRQWLKEGETGARKLQGFLDDLLQHQLALVTALEGIADTALEQFCPQKAAAASPNVFGLRPLAWRTYRKLHRDYVKNRQLRHQNLVIAGFVTGYTRAREQRNPSP